MPGELGVSAHLTFSHTLLTVADSVSHPPPVRHPTARPRLATRPPRRSPVGATGVRRGQRGPFRRFHRRPIGWWRWFIATIIARPPRAGVSRPWVNAPPCTGGARSRSSHQDRVKWTAMSLSTRGPHAPRLNGLVLFKQRPRCACFDSKKKAILAVYGHGGRTQ